MLQPLVVLFLVLIGASCRPIDDTAVILHDKLSGFLTQQQYLQLGKVLENSIYLEKAPQAIADDFATRLGQIFTADQARILNNANGHISDGLGRGSIRFGQLLNLVLNKQFEKGLLRSLRVAKIAKARGATKAEVSDEIWNNVNTDLAKKVEKSVLYVKKRLTLNQYKAVTSGWRRIVRFNLY